MITNIIVNVNDYFVQLAWQHLSASPFALYLKVLFKLMFMVQYNFSQWHLC